MNTSYENTTSPVIPVTTKSFPILGFSIFIASILSLPGNIWTLCVLSTKLKNVSTTTRSFMQLTALSDLLFALTFTLPTTISIFRQEWVFGQVFCHIKMVEGPATFIMSIYAHMATAVHRYNCLSQDELRRESPVIRKASIVAISVFSQVITVPVLFLADGSEDSVRCDITNSSSIYLRIYSMTLRIIGGVIPVCLVVCCYLAIVIKSRKLVNRVCPSVPPTNQWSRSAKVTKVCLYTTSAFLLTAFPFHICHILMIMYPDMTGIVAVTSLTFTFYILHTCLQPVIFSLVWDAYRQESKQVFDNIKKAGKRCFKI